MVCVSSLSPIELKDRVRRTGICIQIGPFVSRFQSSINSVIDSIGNLYRDYEIADEAGFSDFHIRLAKPRNLRRWYRPQVNFHFDDLIPFKPLPFTQAFPLLEWGLNWCIAKNANQYLILHAAVVEKDGYAVIMPAPPGFGKSTLCAALVSRGWRLLSDEMAMISPETGMLTPVPRPVSLKNESIDIMKKYAPDQIFGFECPDTTKGTVAHMKPPEDSVKRANEHAIPAWIINPRYSAKSGLKLIPQSKGRIFMQMAVNSFNFNQLGSTGFEVLSDLAENCTSYELIYSNLDEAIEVMNSLEVPQHILQKASSG